MDGRLPNDAWVHRGEPKACSASEILDLQYRSLPSAWSRRSSACRFPCIGVGDMCHVLRMFLPMCRMNFSPSPSPFGAGCYLFKTADGVGGRRYQVIPGSEMVASLATSACSSKELGLTGVFGAQSRTDY